MIIAFSLILLNWEWDKDYNNFLKQYFEVITRWKCGEVNMLSIRQFEFVSRRWTFYIVWVAAASLVPTFISKRLFKQVVWFVCVPMSQYASLRSSQAEQYVWCVRYYNIAGKAVALSQTGLGHLQMPWSWAWILQQKEDWLPSSWKVGIFSKIVFSPGFLATDWPPHVRWMMWLT